jgi:hypothetical protein
MLPKNEPSLDKTKLADHNIITRLKDFNEQITASGVVSREDILSLEEFIGASIITSKTPINLFTATKSSIGVDEACEVVERELAGSISAGKITYNDLYVVTSEVYGKLDHILKHLVYLKSVPSEIMARFLNEKYIWSYVNEHGIEGNDMIDISRTIPVMSLFLYRNNYLSGITSMIDTSNRTFDNIKHLANDLLLKHTNEVSTDYTPLLSAIYSKSLWKLFYNQAYTLDIITVRNIVEIYNDIDSVIEHFNGFIGMVKTDYDDLTANYSEYMYNDNKWLMRTYNHYRNIASVINDEVSETILDILKQFKQEY